MTPEQEEALRTITQYYMTEALNRTVDLVGQPDERVREGLYPHWRQAVHTIMVKAGACKCETDPSGCLQDMSKDELIGLFRPGHPLSFDELFHAFRQGEQMALGTMLGPGNGPVDP